MVAGAEYDPIVVEPTVTAQKIDELVKVARESAKLDYKRQYDPQARQNVVEVAKDLVAMANTAGGYIVIGVEDDGTPRGLSAREIGALDEAVLRSQVEAFIGIGLDLFLDRSVRWNNLSLAVVTVLQSSRSPLVFEKDGQYPTGTASSRNNTVFRAGDVFVRHGSKSERWNNDDVSTIYRRVVAREKERWLAEVLPDIRRLLADARGQPAAAPSPREQVIQDAETFEGVLRDALRRPR